MLLALALTLGVAILIGYYPLQLHLDSLRLAQPIVIFQGRFWRGGMMPWTLGGLVFAGFLLALAGLLATRPTSGFVAVLGALIVAIFGVGISFIILRLHVSYWQHDQHATLTVHQQAQRAEYHNKGISVSFNLADVVQITHYANNPHNTRAPIWSNYSYRVYVLQDGTELLLTRLMYSLIGPQDLMPTTNRLTVPRYICWLPGDELNFPTLF